MVVQYFVLVDTELPTESNTCVDLKILLLRYSICEKHVECTRRRAYSSEHDIDFAVHKCIRSVCNADDFGEKVLGKFVIES